MRAYIVSGMLALAACAVANGQEAVSPATAAPNHPEVAEPDFPHVVCQPQATQGGAVLCKAPPDAALTLDGKVVTVADSTGFAVVGLDLRQRSPAVIDLKVKPQLPVGYRLDATSATVEVLGRHDDKSVLSMDCGKISPQNPADQRKAEVSWVKKDKALKSFHDRLEPFALLRPVEASDAAYSISSFGKTRTYKPKTSECNGRESVHHGTDIAVPTGTEIHAPMGGTVLLADPDLFYEGGAVFLDIGNGLVSVTMHMSRIDVSAGDVVAQGELLGLSGATGRVTGPHVHWGIKYRNPLESDRGGDIWLDPMLLLKLDPSELGGD
ncbi:MAG: M23 family metallopeptidase [Hyphomonadaceae bacterium]